MTATIAQLRKAVERIQCGERFNAGDEAVVSIVTENQNNSEAHSNIHWKSMDLLSRREHSYSELKKKLTRRFEGSEVVIESVLCELQEKNLELEELNTQDALTGLRNRRHFDKKIKIYSLIYALLRRILICVRRRGLVQ